jgi:ribose transport system permease protein
MLAARAGIAGSWNRLAHHHDGPQPGMELTVIAAVIESEPDRVPGPPSARRGAALIEVIRNSLTLLGISTFWQGTFVGSFIVVAVLFDRLRSRGAND